MWNPEYTTCPRWAEYAERTHHLAKDFAIRSTAAQINTSKEAEQSTTHKAVKSKPQGILRSKLTELLNNEIRELTSLTLDMISTEP